MNGMRSFWSYGFICLALVVSLAVVCPADSPPVSIIYVQGGESIITAEPNGTSMITIHDVIPYYCLQVDNMSNLIPIQNLVSYSGPMEAALVFTDEENERISMGSIDQVTLSDDNRVLILQVKPLEFYEGSGLKTFSDDREDLLNQTGEKVLSSGLYLEVQEPPSNNQDIRECINSCIARGNGMSLCWRMCERAPEPIPTPRRE